MFVVANAIEGFTAFGMAHRIVLLLAMLAVMLMFILTRHGWVRVARGFEIMLAVMLLLEWPLNLFADGHFQNISAENALPFQFCDVAALVGALALLTHKAGLVELLYFWGLAGTMQGLITPALSVDWPHPRFVTFFMLHAGVVMAAIQLVFARGITPRRGAVPRAIGWLVVYAAFAGAVNVIIKVFGGHANYGFLCEKPPTASLFDLLGPWPWYIGVVGIIAWVFFSVLDLPFLVARRKGGENQNHANTSRTG